MIPKPVIHELCYSCGKLAQPFWNKVKRGTINGLIIQPICPECEKNLMERSLS